MSRLVEFNKILPVKDKYLSINKIPSGSVANKDTKPGKTHVSSRLSLSRSDIERIRNTKALLTRG